MAFARAGAKVVVADIDVEGSNETVRMVKELDGEAIFVKTDVSKAVEIQALIGEAIQTYGRLDCAFNNAGVSAVPASTADYIEEEWDRVIATNLKGVWLCMKYEIPQILRQSRGAIVNTSSIDGLVGEADSCAYVASKHGVAGVTKAAAIEYGKAGLRINAVCPGHVDTPFVRRFRALDPEAYAQSIEPYPIGRVGKPEEIAEAVVWLSSDAASFVTGHTMVVDGGFVAQ